MKNKILAECRFYEKKYLGVMGEFMSVRPVPDLEDALGYTSKNGGIFITFAERHFKCVHPKKHSYFRMGIFTHETLHQYFTDFDTNAKVADSYPISERRVFTLISNILEDPAIEYWAYDAIGGDLLKSLNYTIAQIYKESPPISESKDAFSQYINALIQVGDMGPVKGDFTFEEAELYFKKTIKKFFDGIHEPNPTKRIYIAKEITEDIRPLWEPLTKNEIDNIIEDYLSSKSAMNGEGSGTEGTSESKNSKDERRKATVSTFLPNDSDEKSEDDSENKSIDNSENNSSNNANKKDDNSDNKEESNKNSNNSSPDISKNNSKSKNEETNSDKSLNDTKNTDNSDSLNTSSSDNSLSGLNTGNANINSKGEIDYEEYEISDDDIEALEESIQRLKFEEEKNEAKKNKDEKLDKIEDLDIESPFLFNKSCLNRKITLNSSEADYFASLYNSITHKYSSEIKSAIKQIRRILQNDVAEKKYSSTGSLSAKRLQSKKTNRVFYKHTEPENKDDAAIFILVDESLSMNSWNRISYARESCICLAEIFGTLEIPMYVMGFSADAMGYDVIHDHFLRWSFKPADRYSLANINCHMDNCDGYSIRYATELLKKKNAKHKLLVVISDGRPSAFNYPNGVKDTSDAIRDAKKTSSVLGVNIGDDDAEVLRGMYGLEYIQINKTDEMFLNLNKRLTNIIKGW